MVVGGAIVSDVNNIMGGMESTSGVKLNHRRKLRQRFDLVRKLGQGTYGKVQLGINKETGQEVAIKTIKKAKIETEADLIRIRREIQIMSSVRHPNIIHIYEVFENKEKMVLVMEYAAGGELYDYLSERKILNEVEARRIFRQVASAVYYCHKHKICHRDLKLENILLDETQNAKIADFGLSNVFDDRSLLTTFCGSPLYASPEIVRGTPYLGPEVDCWSLGVLLYTLVYGAMPFDGSNFKRLVKQISSGEYYEPKKPSSASPLIRHMLTVEPAKRATVEDICSHWWVNEGYGESCLEVAEDLANQTPVRLDLLISLMPPPTNSDAVMIGKLDSSMASPPVSATNDVECDSMNEYYSAHSNAANVSEAVLDEAGSPNKKSKKKKEKDGGKRKREETSVPETTANKKQETSESKEPLEGKQNEERKVQVPPPKADSPVTVQKLELSQNLAEDQLLNLAPKEDVASHEEVMEVDEGVSTSSSWTAAHFDPNLGDKIAGLSEPGAKLKQVETEPRIPPLLPVEPKEEPIIHANLVVDAVENQKVTKENTPNEGCTLVPKEDETPKNKEIQQNVKQLRELSNCSESTMQKSKTQIEGTADKIAVEREQAPRLQDEGERTELHEKTDLDETARPRDRKISGDEVQSTVSNSTTATQLDKRNSKILRQAELFNSLVGSKTEPRTMTLERPKKVTIYGFKVQPKTPGLIAISETNKTAAVANPASTAVTTATIASPCPEITPALAVTTKVAKPEEAKVKKLKTPSLKLAIGPTTTDQNKEIDVVLDTGAPEPKKAAMLISGSTTVHGQNSKEATSPPPRPFSPVSTGQTKATAPPTVPPKPAKSAAPTKLSSPPPSSGRTLERREKFERSADKGTEEPIVAGSENMFLRSLRSPGRELQEPMKRNSKIQTENAEATVIIPDALPPSYKTEISGNIAAVPPQSDVPVRSSAQQLDINRSVAAPSLRAEVNIPLVDNTSTNHQLQKQQSLKERIIPIEIEGRAETVVKPVLSAQNSVSSSTSTLTRLTSPPPPSKVRQESVRSPTPSETESLRIREPIRKSPREFIIPISVEGGGFVTPKEILTNPPVLSSRNAQSTSRQKTSRLDRTKRFGGFFNDFTSESEDSNASAMHSPSHTLQRLSSFGKGYADIKLDEQKRRSELQRSGSGSSGDDDDDDDTFQILTAESLFSTLLSRVRQLTRRSNREGGEPFAGSVRSSRYTSPAPSSGSNGTCERNGVPKYSASVTCNQSDPSNIQSPTTSCVTSPSIKEGSMARDRNRNGFFPDAGSATGAMSQEPKGAWTTLYSRPSSVASDATSRRYSTLDSPRHGINREDWNSMPWRNRSISRDTSDTESVYSTPATSTLPRGTSI